MKHSSINPIRKAVKEFIEESRKKYLEQKKVSGDASQA